MRPRLVTAFLLLAVLLFPWAVSASAASSTLASYTWMADGAKYASARADGSGYVYKGALVFERNAAGKLSHRRRPHHRRAHQRAEGCVDSGDYGDIIVYHGDTSFEHSMTITKTDGTLKGAEVYGQGGLEIKNHTDKAIEAWTKPYDSEIVRKSTPDRVPTNKEIRQIIRQLEKNTPNE